MKQLLIILSLIFISAHSYGQVYLGLSSGISITKFKNEYASNVYNNPECDPLIGFINMDIPVLFKFNKNIALQSGLSYLNMGTTIDGTTYNVIDVSDPIYQELRNSHTNYRLNYLSLPITFNFTIPLNKYSLYAKAGGYISTLLYGTTKNSNTGTKRSVNVKDDPLNPIDFGIITGLGITRTIGRGFLFVDAKYMMGAANINRSSNSESFPFGANELKNRGVFFNVGYMFNLSKAK